MSPTTQSGQPVASATDHLVAWSVNASSPTEAPTQPSDNTNPPTAISLTTVHSELRRAGKARPPRRASTIRLVGIWARRRSHDRDRTFRLEYGQVDIVDFAVSMLAQHGLQVGDAEAAASQIGLVNAAIPDQHLQWRIDECRLRYALPSRELPYKNISRRGDFHDRGK